MAFDGAGTTASGCSGPRARAAAALLSAGAGCCEGCGAGSWLPSSRIQAAAGCSTDRWASNLRGRFACWVFGYPSHFGWLPANAAAGAAAAHAAAPASRQPSGTEHYVPRYSANYRHDYAGVCRRTARQDVQRPLSRPHYRRCHGHASSANGIRLAGTVIRQAVHGVTGASYSAPLRQPAVLKSWNCCAWPGGAAGRQAADAAMWLPARADLAGLDLAVLCQLLPVALGRQGSGRQNTRHRCATSLW